MQTLKRASSDGDILVRPVVSHTHTMVIDFVTVREGANPQKGVFKYAQRKPDSAEWVYYTKHPDGTVTKSMEDDDPMKTPRIRKPKRKQTHTHVPTGRRTTAPTGLEMFIQKHKTEDDQPKVLSAE